MGDGAWLAGYLGDAEVALTFVEFNLNDLMDQTITLGAVDVDQVIFWYGNALGVPINLIEVVDNISFTIFLGPTSAEELAQLASATGTMARLFIGNARHVARSNGRESLVSRDQNTSATLLQTAEAGEEGVTQSTSGSGKLVCNIYSWIELSGFTADDDADGRSYNGRGVQVGFDMALSQDMVAGLSFGLQDLDSSVGAFSQDGTLRFVQPYLAYRSGAWSGEASLILGRGDFDQTSTGGTGTGETRLTAVAFTGGYEMPIDDKMTVVPTFGLIHGKERVEGTGGTLAGAGTDSVRFSEVSLGVELARAIEGGEVFAGLHLDWLDTSGETELVSTLLQDDGWTGRVELGLTNNMDNGLLLDTSVALSGIGGDLRSTKGSLNFAFRF